jgi:Flp pilus assembly pilin Flp
MTQLIAKTQTFLAGESGTTSVEYAVMLALIIGICFAAIRAVGGQSGNMWSDNSAKIQAATN